MLPRITTRADAYGLAVFLTLGLTLAAVVLVIGITTLIAPAGGELVMRTALIVVLLATLTVAAPFSLFASFGLLKAHESGERMRHMAETDPLTGLPNRAATLKRIRAAVDQCRVRGQEGALLFVDLDHFKAINDSFGHAGGDAALAHAADIMRMALGKGMIVGRFGGEEFVCFADNAAEAAATALAIIVALRNNPASFGEQEIPVTASIGLAVMGDAITVEALLENADRALYLAKSAGRNRIVHHDDIRILAPMPEQRSVEAKAAAEQGDERAPDRRRHRAA